MSHRNILVVEDSPTDALIVKHALRRKFNVQHVLSPAEAQALLEKERFAAVVTDYSLPGGSGLELQRWIAEQKLGIPVIIMSGHGDERVATEALKLGAYDYVVKSEETLAALGVVVEQALRRHELEHRAQILQQIVEHASDAIITMRPDGAIQTANRSTGVMFGLSADDLADKELSTLFPREENETELRQMLAAGAAGQSWQGELSGRRLDGTRFPAHMSCSHVRDRGGQVEYLIGIARDVTERRQFLEKLKMLSVTDNLTGLYNHRFFHDRLQYEFIRARRYGNPLGCVMMDVDFFKSVNDTYGHLAGDDALKALAGMIGKAVRTVDLVARYGGEEFAVLLPNTGLEGTLSCAEHIWETIGQSIIQTRMGTLQLTISAGVAALTDDIKNEEELCRRADEALLAAKRGGRNNVRVWEGMARRERDNSGEEGHEGGVDLRRLLAPAKAAYAESLRPLLESLIQRDPELRRRSAAVTGFAVELGRAAGLSPEEMDTLKMAALIAAVARMGSASDTEDAGGFRKLLAELRLLTDERDYLLHLTGAPGDGKPDRGAQVLALADTFDRLTAPGATRTALSEEDALQELQRSADGRFDAELARLFANVRKKNQA